MKKIILSLILILGIGFGGSVYGEDNNKIEKVFLKGEKEGIIQLPLYSKKQIIIFIKNINSNYTSKGFSIDIIKKPIFLEGKIKNGINYFEIDYNKVNIKSNNKYYLEFEILINGKKTGFIKKNELKIIKPNILFIGELGPEGGSIMNNWEDAYIKKIDKGILDKKYKIASLYYENNKGERTYYTLTNPGINILLEAKYPPTLSNYKTTSNETKNPITNWTTINIKKFKGNTNIVTGIEMNEEIKEYNECISDKQKLYGDKLNCFKKYMGLGKNIVNNNKSKFIKQLIVSKIKLKNSKFGKIIPKFEGLIPKISDKKLLEIDKKISNFPGKVRNNKKYKDILDYLEAKIKLELLKRGI